MSVVTCAGASAQVVFSNNLDSANAGGTGRYGFDGVHNNNGQWSVAHLATGGWQGSGAAQFTLNAGQEQYMFGFWSPSLGWTPVQGNSMFVRLRMRWPSGQPATTNFRMKFILFGPISDGTDATSRVIIFLATSGGSACGPDQGTSFYDGGYQEYHKPSDYGVNLSNNRWTGNYVGLAAGRNIEGPGACAAPPILMTSFNNTNRGTPGYNHGRFGTVAGAPASDGWYHIQVEARSGSAGNAYIKQWANNNNYGTPTSAQNPLRYAANGAAMGLAATGWGDGASLGAYVDTAPSATFSYIVDDFQVGRSFDPNWYPGGGGSTIPAPASPENVRIIRSSFELLSIGTLGLAVFGRLMRRRAERRQPAQADDAK
jgi:hypothetical protein